MANHNKWKQHNEPIRTRQRQARENAGDQVAIGFSFASDSLIMRREFLNQSQNGEGKINAILDYFRQPALKPA